MCAKERVRGREGAEERESRERLERASERAREKSEVMFHALQSASASQIFE